MQNRLGLEGNGSLPRTIQGLQPAMTPSDDHIRKLRRVTEKVIGLPALPTIVTQLITLVGNPRSSARDVAKLISTDQALTAKILRVANSAFYGFPRRIATIQLAIVVLGFETVKNLGLSVTVLKRFSRGTEHRLFDRERFWEHAIACGVAARMLAQRLRYRLEGEAFVGGLLHDVGKLILIEYFHPEFSEALELAEAEGLTIAEAEERVFGVTHADVGGWLAERWNLPQALVGAISHHHRLGDGEMPDELVMLTHVADAVARHHRVGGSGDQQGPRLDPEVAQRLKGAEELPDEALLDRLSEGFEAELEKAQVFRDLGE